MIFHSDPVVSRTDRQRLPPKYRGVIQEIGPMATEFLPHGILIFFGVMAPEELREVSFIHDGQHLVTPIVVGDLLIFTSPDTAVPGTHRTQYRVTAVGEMANTNLATLGHLVVHFDGATIPHLPGTISVEPSLTLDLYVGTTFELLELERLL